MYGDGRIDQVAPKRPQPSKRSSSELASLLYPTTSAARMAASFRVSAMAALSPQGRVAQSIVQDWSLDWLTPEAAPRKRLGARQLALSCDPIVLFEGVPDLVLTFTILCSGQSFCDQIRSRRCVERRPHRSFGVKIHKLANLKFVFGHARIEPSVCQYA